MPGKLKLNARAALAAASAVLVGLFVNSGASADTLNTSARGWYQNTGFHDSTNDNYIVGVSGGNTFNDFFTFDVSGVSGTVTSAILTLWNPSGGSTGPGTFTLSDVSTLPTLLNSSQSAGPTGIGIYNDLGSGSTYGSYAYSTADNGTFINITLNSQFLSAINGPHGNKFSIGGSAVGGTFLFGFTGTGNPGDGNTKLTLGFAQATPLPNAATAGCLLFMAIGAFQFRRTNRAAT